VKRDCVTPIGDRLCLGAEKADGINVTGGKSKWCHRDGCVPEDFVCSAMSMHCPADKPLRCPNWQCAATREECPTTEIGGGDLCATMGPMVMCPDGQHYQMYSL
jgi:hypothetical protein